VGYSDNNYRAVCRRVIDGDTIHVEVDLGLRVKRTLDVRLIGVNAPELKGSSLDAGRAAKAYLERLLFDNGLPLPLVLKFEKGKSFDRWLARVYLERTDTEGITLLDVQEALIKTGHAEEAK